MDTAQRKILQTKAKQLKPVIAIGKQGLSPTVIEQIKLYLKAHNLCKVKFNKDVVDELAISKKEFGSLVAKQTDSEIIDQIGFVIALYKR
jgi:RNA-binding protein